VPGNPKIKHILVKYHRIQCRNKKNPARESSFLPDLMKMGYLGFADFLQPYLHGVDNKGIGLISVA
jgi:hypothetical protein